MAGGDTSGSEEPAAARRVRPRVKPEAGAERPLGRPHLLLGRPPVGGALLAEEVAAEGPLELQAHLQPAPVGGVRVGPAPLVPLDAEPGRAVRRPLRAGARAD